MTTDPNIDLAHAARKLKAYLEEEKRAGAHRIICRANSTTPPERPAPEPAQPSSQMLKALASLEKRVRACTKCPLSQTRTNVVFGAGNAEIKIMFIGEAPGRDEDLQGIPFVGRAGQLLTKIISTMGYSRDDVYIANVLKCRPPENRDPSQSEVEACSPYLLKQIEIIEPRVICALGLHAAHLLLNVRTPMNKLRGNIHFFRGTKVIPTYHPAACLRYPSLKRQVWDDMQFLKKEYEAS